MGCRDRFSNFNNMSYHNGEWRCGWGHDFSYTAPTQEIIALELGERIGNFELSQEPSGEWVAHPTKEMLHVLLRE